MFEEPTSSFHFPSMEQKILDFWKKADIFHKSLKQREGKKEFVFYEGPPTANGMPHPGHVLTRVVKDLFPRYKAMCGYHVARKAGWDTHGLPVEIEVEKELGLQSKADIEKYGIEPFIKKCKASVFKYKQAWEKMTERIGFWIDMDQAYITYTTDYIESVWWAIQEIWKKGLLYQGYKILPWCSRCGTGLSSHEVGLGYKTVKDPAIYVAFKVKGEEHLYLAAWTTTPWTLLSNVALAVGPDYDYVYVETDDGDQVILAKALAEKLFPEGKVVKEVKGNQLAGIEYEPLFSFVKPEKPCWKVVTADFVTLSEGTGIVHIAPAFGEDDFQVAQKNDLPVIQLVKDDGSFKEEVTPWKGRFVKDCDKEITKDLKKRGHLIKSGVYEHEYPFCWRCDTPLLYFARPAWFIRTTEVIQKIIKLNEKINWIPEHIKHGRFGRFLENNRDWALSRERFWGTPLPIWICENPKCKNELVIGSIQELVSQKGYKGPKSPEPHKPYIDEVSFECEKCGKNMRRVPEVIDCWFDSGSMPFAQWGYPHQNQDKFKRFFPADFISEAMDQTRGWFYTLLMINGILFEKSPYQNCLVLGLILGEDGKKMSKRLGNYVEPTQMLEEVGADAMRWYFYSTAPTWTSIRFFPQAVKEAQKDFHIKIWNCYSFFTIYANLDEYNPQKKSMKVAWKNRSELDQWILSEFQNMVEEVRENLDKYHIFPAAQAILRFVDGLSNWYIRRSRNRFWKSEKDQDKWAAYSTLYEVLVGLSKVIAPFVPFLAEEIYQNLVVKIQKDAPESVHLCDYPKVDNSKRDMELVKKMALVREIVTLGHNSRMQEKIKVRQPLPKVLIVLADPEIQKDIEPFRDLILEELNVKDLEFLPKASEYVHYRFKPNFKILGPKYGKEMGAIQKALAKASGPKAYQELKEKGKLKLQINQKTILLDKEEVLVELVSKEGFTAADGRGVVVILDVRLTEDLILEGMARDLVNRIQKLRKKAELQYDDRIHTRLYCEKKVLESAKKFQDYIQKETLTKQLDFEDAPFEGQESFQMEGTKVILEIQKIKNVNAGAKKNTEKG